MSDLTFFYGLVPARLRVELQVYVEQGIRPGEFLTAVLDNQLAEAFRLVDPDGLLDHAERWRDMSSVLNWLEQIGPVGCYGGPQRVEAWVRKGGLSGTPEQVRPWTGWPIKADPALLAKVYPQSFPELSIKKGGV